MADFRLSYLPALFYYNATLENLILGTFLPHNGLKPLGMQPKHGDDSEPVLRRLALLKAGSEGRPRNFRRFPPLTAASQSTVFHTITTTPIFNLNLTCRTSFGLRAQTLARLSDLTSETPIKKNCP